MRNWYTRAYPADAYYEGLPTAGEYPTLATLARVPETVAAINRAREVADKDRWQQIAQQWKPTEAELNACKGILFTLPGCCCLNDAANLAARL